jgi:hypothetical protein
LEWFFGFMCRRRCETPMELRVSADPLLSDNTTSIKDKELLKKFEVIQEMSLEEKAIVLRFLDLSIRDYKTRKTYATD